MTQLLNFILIHAAPTLTIRVEGVTNATAGAARTLTCSVSGVDIRSSDVTSVMYTWLRDGSIVQAASSSNQYTISAGSIGVSNAKDVYTCQVSVTASYWDVSGEFEGTGSGNMTVASEYNRFLSIEKIWLQLFTYFKCDC